MYQLKPSDFLHRLVFPRHFRSLPQRRLVLNVLRSIHIICFSILLGGFYFDQAISQLNLWALSVLLSGVGLFLVDLYGSAIVLFEVRGLTVLIKIMLLLIALPLAPADQFKLLIIVVIISSFVSHSPRWLRHKNVLPSVWRDKLSPLDEKPLRDK